MLDLIARYEVIRENWMDIISDTDGEEIAKPSDSIGHESWI